MKRNHPAASYFTAMQVWNDFAVQSAEIAVASAQVIGHRTGRLAAAGAAPSARDQKEFVLMGQEKFEAGTQSAFAMAAHMMTMNQSLGVQAFENLMRSTTALLSLANSTTPKQLGARQAELARALEQSALTATDLTESATRLAHHGLKPIHAKVRANAKRLGKRR